jgi:hypothetical protein
MKAPTYLEWSETTHPTAQRHIPDMNPQQHNSENLKSRIFFVSSFIHVYYYKQNQMCL